MISPITAGGAASLMGSLPAGGKFQRLANGVQTGGTNDLA